MYCIIPDNGGKTESKLGCLIVKCGAHVCKIALFKKKKKDFPG